MAKYCIDLVSALSAQGERGHAVEIYEKALAIYLKARRAGLTMWHVMKYSATASTSIC